MGIVGSHPETGVRIDVQRARDGDAPWKYEGQAVTPEASFAVVCAVAEDGCIDVQLEAGAPGGLGEKVRLLLRAAWKHAQDDEMAPPRRIVRWRADR